MQFNVELSELAEKQYDIILSYISNVLKNPQALENVMDDFDDTVGKLGVFYYYIYLLSALID